MPTLNIPVGVSDFSEIRQNGYYYVDKMNKNLQGSSHHLKVVDFRLWQTKGFYL